MSSLEGLLPQVEPVSTCTTPPETEIVHVEQKLGDIKNGAEKYTQILHRAIDEATQSIIGELDRLTKEIEGMKSKIISNGGAAKAGIAEHLSLGSEATKFAEDIRSKLNGYIVASEAVTKP